MTGLTSPPYTDEDARDAVDSYTDDQARSAVDGSNVAVEQANSANVADVASNADNADQLGGQPPSTFETPNSTGETQQGGGWVTLVDKVITGVEMSGQTETFSVDSANNAVRLTASEVEFDDAELSQATVSINGDTVLDEGPEPIDKTANYEGKTGGTVELYLNLDGPFTSADVDVDLEIYTVALPGHTHPL